jgi:hypothetical protein
MAQASTMTDSESGVRMTVSAGASHGSGVDIPTPVLVELLRQVPSLSSEETEAIMWLFVRLDEIHGLRLADDMGFITRILPLVSGSLLTFLGSCLRANNSRAECKSQLLQEYFPHIVRERLIRDLIVFSFQGEGQSLRAYIEQVFGATHFLELDASESDLVDTVVMNFHASILAHAAFVEKPCSLKELQRVVELIEEKFAVAKERQRV